MTAAPDFRLPGTTSGPRSLADLTSDGPAVLLFGSEECPTSTLALRRLAPLVAPLREAGVALVPVLEDPPEVAARTARRAGWPGSVLAEPAPYDVSRAYDLVSLPTLVAVGRDGGLGDRVVGWDATAVQALLDGLTGGRAPRVPVEAPTRKPGCAAKSTYDAAEMAVGAEDDVERMYELGWTDGLPTVPPTPERVAAMLGRHDPDRSLGPVAPAMGDATLARVAACAVLAGCLPAYFPVVLAAVEAALDPAFNLGGQAVTTQPCGQLVVVNGPVRHELGIELGAGALGPGTRANMTIGRALRLVVTLTGGGAPGRLDRSTLGHPGKVGFCVAEDEETSPWEPLHVERGFDPGASVVTVIGSDAPLSISDHRSRTPEELTHVLAQAAAVTWSPYWWPMEASSVFVLCPEHVAMFRDARWSKQRLRAELFDALVRPAGELRRGETTPVVHAAPDDAPVRKWTSPDDVVLLVAGGEAGRYSALLGPCLGMGTRPVSREVVR